MKRISTMYSKHFSEKDTSPTLPPVKVSRETKFVVPHVSRVTQSLIDDSFASLEAAIDRMGDEIDKTTALIVELDHRIRRSHERCPGCHQFSNCKCGWN